MAARKSGPARVYQPQVILPEVFDTLRRQPTPETRLMIAILEEAINCFQKYCLAEHDSGQRLFREADEWLMRNQIDWAFSFESICDTLGLDPSYVRYGLRQWQSRHLRTNRRHDAHPPVESPPTPGHQACSAF